MCLSKDVTKYQTDWFSQKDMLNDHSARVLKTFQNAKKEMEADSSGAAEELAKSSAQTFKLIHDVSKGVCAALCIKWIKMIASDSHLPMAKLKNDITFAKAVIRHNAANVPLRQQEQLSQSYKLKAQKKELNFSRSLTLIVQDVLSSPGVFYLVSFITSTGSHVIAVSSGDCKAVLIFDPNFGEFKLQKSRLEDFLSALLKEGYKAEPKAINGLSQWTFNA